MKNITRVLNYVPHIRRYLAVLIGLNLFSSVVSSVQPLAFKVLIDHFAAAASNLTAADFRFAALLLVGVLALRILATCINYFVDIRAEIIFYRLMVELRQAVFEQISKLDIDYFERTRVGAIVERYGTSTLQVAEWTDQTLSNFLPQVMTLIIALGILTYVEPAAGLIVVIAMALFFWQQIPILRKLRPLLIKSEKHLETASGYFTETVTHIATVRSFGGEAGAIRRQRAELDEYRDIRIERQKTLQRNIAIRSSIMNIAMISAIGLVAYGITTGRHTPGDILLVALYIQQIQGTLWPLGRLITNSGEIDASAQRINQMLDQKPHVSDAPDAEELKTLERIEFRNVSFTYPGKKKPVLDGISFELEPGQTLALVGPSGTGKTTITKLLLRFYEPSGGEILVNGRPVRDFTAASLRNHIGMVMQDVALFNDTIEANLQLAAPNATTEQVRTAAAQAHADVFIEQMPEKYETLVGERGIKLSGGEKQRVAVARAILKQPNLIVLDEATSALDSESERHVQAGLHQLMEGRTAIVIAHRLSTVMQADQILVMRGGQIIERGTHAELAKKRGGLYARLFKLQTEGLVPEGVH